MKSFVLDVEVFPNYFLVSIKNIDTQEVTTFEMSEESDLNRDALRATLGWGRFITFNGIRYDMVIIGYALAGADCAKLKMLNDEIIVERGLWWELEGKYGFKCPVCEHLDLMDVAPGMVGLKTYGARLHSKRLQDLPYPPDERLTDEQMVIVKGYCINDLDTTIDLYSRLLPQLRLRKGLSVQYGVNLLSKSDAQIAEKVLQREIQKRGGITQKPSAKTETFKYKPPSFIGFKTEVLQNKLEDIKQANFGIDRNSKLITPYALDTTVTVAGKKYAMGIGGLHSQESNTSVRGGNIFDRDVTSYYPSIILNNGYAPPHLGKTFLEVYKGIVDRRVEAKNNGDKVTADCLKIVVNGSFGKFGSPYSFLFAPHLLVHVTVTGQLSLLMLIEDLTLGGHEIYSANTDGVTVIVNDHESYLKIVEDWEKATGFLTEETQYRAVYSRDVNNYIALKNKGYKVKGAFAPSDLAKNPVAGVVTEAIIKFLDEGVPIRDTVEGCDDIRQFLTARSVAGGGVWRGQYLGKVVRWYYSKTGEPIRYQTNGNKVAKTDFAVPMMEIGAFPDDLDKEWYISEAYKTLGGMGYVGEGRQDLLL